MDNQKHRVKRLRVKMRDKHNLLVVYQDDKEHPGEYLLDGGKLMPVSEFEHFSIIFDKVLIIEIVRDSDGTHKFMEMEHG